MYKFIKSYTDLAIAIIVVIGATFILISAGRSGTPIYPHYIVPGADANLGAAAMTSYGCSACHNIPGISGANALVGPPLDRYGSRTYIAGQFPNQPTYLIAWIKNPQAMIPGNAMPNLNVSDQDARNIAAYLYNLR